MNTIESLYSIKKNTQMTDFAVLFWFRKKPKFIESKETAILSKIQEPDSELIALLKKAKNEWMEGRKQ